jgi:UbiA prenyltransferase family protein
VSDSEGGLLGYLSRMRIFFAEGLPLGQHTVVACLTYFALASFARATHEGAGPFTLATTLCGVWSVFNVFVLLRVMDSLKDLESDRVDFPERPLPSGRVKEEDVRRTLWLACLALPLVNLACGAAAALSAGFVLGYLLLMYRWFFLPDLISRDRLLAILTHHPIYPLLLLHLVALFALEQGAQPSDLRWDLLAPCVVLLWLPFLAWELARKIRAPEEETRYETYSSRLGPRGAVAFSLGTEAVGCALAGYFFWRLSLPWWYLALIGVGFLCSLGGHLRYAFRPSPESARLEPYGVGFGLALTLAQLAAFLPSALGAP